jgi:hypothetical protein
MRSYPTAFLFLFTVSCVAAQQDSKTDKLLPPAESHGKTISAYGCDKIYISDNKSTSNYISYWTLSVWAEYGSERKKYWQKTYGNFEVPFKNSFHTDAESARSGGAVGAYGAATYDFTPMNKACAEWGLHLKSTFKINLALDREGQKIIR